LLLKLLILSDSLAEYSLLIETLNPENNATATHSRKASNYVTTTFAIVLFGVCIIFILIAAMVTLVLFKFFNGKYKNTKLPLGLRILSNHLWFSMFLPDNNWLLSRVERSLAISSLVFMNMGFSALMFGAVKGIFILGAAFVSFGASELLFLAFLATPITGKFSLMANIILFLLSAAGAIAMMLGFGLYYTKFEAGMWIVAVAVSLFCDFVGAQTIYAGAITGIAYLKERYFNDTSVETPKVAQVNVQVAVPTTFEENAVDIPETIVTPVTTIPVEVKVEVEEITIDAEITSVNDINLVATQLENDVVQEKQPEESTAVESVVSQEEQKEEVSQSIINWDKSVISSIIKRLQQYPACTDIVSDVLFIVTSISDSTERDIIIPPLIEILEDLDNIPEFYPIVSSVVDIISNKKNSTNTSTDISGYELAVNLCGENVIEDVKKSIEELVSQVSQEEQTTKHFKSLIDIILSDSQKLKNMDNLDDSIELKDVVQQRIELVEKVLELVSEDRFQKVFQKLNKSYTTLNSHIEKARKKSNNPLDYARRRSIMNRS
jgi:hypothetical protein